MEGDRIVGYKTDGDDWRYGHIVSHAIFEAVENTADALKAKPARKKPKVEPLQVPAATAKSGPSRDPATTAKTEFGQEPAVKTEPKGRKVNKARDRPIKAEEEALIRELESEAMGNDTLKELDEALMDRTTAQKTLRSKTNFITHHQHTKINSSNFKSNQEPA